MAPFAKGEATIQLRDGYLIESLAERTEKHGDREQHLEQYPDHHEEADLRCSAWPTPLRLLSGSVPGS